MSEHNEGVSGATRYVNRSMENAYSEDECGTECGCRHCSRPCEQQLVRTDSAPGFLCGIGPDQKSG
ncbi:MAG: hypothetical protein GX055_05990 [Desulfovibrionales bacterium]|nr:hypothetical protein [Desulfovibrionales bacterium]